MNYKWERQSFDTDLFGFPVAKISHISSKNVTETSKNIKLLIDELKENNIKYATLRLKASEFLLIHALENAGFLLVDSIVAMNLKGYKVYQKDTCIRAATEMDLPLLKILAGEVFQFNRFFNDPVIPRSKANKVYEQWVENSVFGNAADAVNVWAENNKILGFITLQKEGHIPLIAVSKETQGKGISRLLIQDSFSQFKKWGVEEILIETQLTNTPALRSYQNCGFKVIDSFMTFRWYNE